MKEQRLYLNKRSRLLFLFAGTLVMIVVMSKTGAPLKTPVTPKGILDLEFAYNSSKAAAVLDAWGGSTAENIYVAKINTWLDFIFLFFYSLFLSAACKMLAASFDGFLLITGRLMAKGALTAGIFDVLENAGMLITLQSYISDGGTLLTFIFSVTKWILAAAAVIYILIAGLRLLYQKLRR